MILSELDQFSFNNIRHIFQKNFLITVLLTILNIFMVIEISFMLLRTPLLGDSSIHAKNIIIE